MNRRQAIKIYTETVRGRGYRATTCAAAARRLYKGPAQLAFLEWEWAAERARFNAWNYSEGSWKGRGRCGRGRWPGGRASDRRQWRKHQQAEALRRARVEAERQGRAMAWFQAVAEAMQDPNGYGRLAAACGELVASYLNAAADEVRWKAPEGRAK